MIRVLVADDQAVVRGGLRMILEAQADLEVVGEAADGSEAITMVASLQPDVVLMDIRMPGLDGIEATSRLAQTGTRARVLAITCAVAWAECLSAFVSPSCTIRYADSASGAGSSHGSPATSSSTLSPASRVL